jgi:hypothetical protein
LPHDEVGGLPVQDLLLALGFAYATTSYRSNGLVAADAVGDLTELSDALEATVAGGTGGSVRFNYLVGASEGGLATALTLERAWERFDGGLIACGPVGNFRGQVNYIGDVRVLFDAFFPGVLPGSAIEIPAGLMSGWESTYEPAVRAALAADPSRMAQLIATGRIAVDPEDGSSAAESIVAALWYNVFATNDLRARLGGGNPYDNRVRWYAGSANDLLLNLTVRRFRGDASAVSALTAFETSGRLRRPAQMVHTRFDPVIPFWQAQVYGLEALIGSGLTLFSHPSDNYGHCGFDLEEVLASFAVLVLRVTGGNLLAATSVFSDGQAVARFQDLSQAAGAAPVVMTPHQIAEARLRANR